MSNQCTYPNLKIIDTAYGVDGMVKDRREKYRQTFTVQMVCGIVMCVISAIPIFIALWIFGDNDTPMAVAVAILLVLVAVGVLMIVRACIVWGGFQMLLQEGEYTPSQKVENRKNEYIAPIYWGIFTALYLGISFITNAWDRTWIIWPVAGVAYGVVIGIARILRKRG